MLDKAINGVTRTALHLPPERAKSLFNALPQSVIERMQRTLFRRTLRLAAARSEFYRQEFKRRGIDARRIEHPSELGDFYTTGEDLRTHGAEAFLVGRPDTAFETTGTTSPVPKRAFFSNREINEMGMLSAVALRQLGLSSEDKILSAFDCSFWVSPVVARSAFQYIKCFHVEAGKIPPDEFYERARAYRPTVIFGEPSWVVRLSEIAAKRGVWKMKFIFAGGENITEPARAEVEKIWNAPLFLNYGQTEAFGSLGFECRARAGYHRNDLNFIFEIADPDSDGNGELIYTTLTRDVMPLIRYRSTDVTRLINDVCPCGLKARRIGKILARCDEMVVCGMGNVSPWVFADLLRDVQCAGGEWQVVLTNDGRRDVITLRVEANDTSESARRETETIIFNALRERFPDFYKNLEMRLYEFRVALNQPHSLRGSNRKLRRILDQRQMLAPAVQRTFDEPVFSEQHEEVLSLTDELAMTTNS